MNRLLFTSLLLSLLVVCGCSGNKYGWYKPGATAAQINRDSRECFKRAEDRRTVGNFDSMREAELSGKPFVPYSSTTDIPYPGEKYRMDDDEFTRFRESYDIRRCMEDKGYRWVLKDF